MEPDEKAMHDLTSRLAVLAHAYRGRDKFEVSQHLSNAASEIRAAIRVLQLSRQGTAETAAEPKP
jgi:hypothetical protein